jgi:hypothetical protein
VTVLLFGLAAVNVQLAGVHDRLVDAWREGASDAG